MQFFLFLLGNFFKNQKKILVLRTCSLLSIREKTVASLRFAHSLAAHHLTKIMRFTPCSRSPKSQQKIIKLI